MKERWAEAISARRQWAVDALRELVRHPTVLGQEEPGQRALAGIAELVGFDVQLEPIRLDAIRDQPGFSPVSWDLDGKLNLVGVLSRGERRGRTLAFNGHIDVVSPEPLALWSGPPFDPVVRQDVDGTWVRGRGAGDMKGGTIAAMWALVALRDLGLAPASEVQLHSPVEEECTGNGTLAILAAGHRADACVIPEPFAETVLVRQVGVLWFQVRVLGQAAHVLGAQPGDNAIERTWPIIQALRRLEAEMNEPQALAEGYRDTDHPLNLNVGVIRGGDWASTVAAECLTSFRLGLFPGERVDALQQRVEEAVAEAALGDAWLRRHPPVVEYIGFQAEGCSFDRQGEFGRALDAAHREWRGSEATPLAATCTTDARSYNLYGSTPATCYGPVARSIHGVDEEVSVDSMERVAQVFCSLVERWCGLRETS